MLQNSITDRRLKRKPVLKGQFTYLFRLSDFAEKNIVNCKTLRLRLINSLGIEKKHG